MPFSIRKIRKLSDKPKKHAIVTIITGNIYPQGYAFFNSFDKVDADVYVYQTGCTPEMIGQMKAAGARVIDIPYEDWAWKMMFYKIALIKLFMETYRQYRYVTYMDIDTMVVRDWTNVYKHDFDIGMTARTNARSMNLAINAGVLFFKKSKATLEFLDWALSAIQAYSTSEVDEYIPEFRHESLYNNYRKIGEKQNLKKLVWWVDQVFLACVAEELMKNKGREFVKHLIGPAYGYKIGLFNCPRYNDTTAFTIGDLHDKKYMKDRFIIHFKGKRKNRVYPDVVRELMQNGKLKIT